MRRRYAALLLAALLTGPVAVPAGAGPLDPRGADRIETWLIERIGTAPRPLEFPVEFTAWNERSMLFSVGFERRGGVRDLHDAQYTGFYVNATGGAYPRVYADGNPLLPPCPAEVTCTNPEPAAGTTVLNVMVSRVPTRLSLYLVAVNLTVHRIGDVPGWRIRALPRGGGVAVHTVRRATGVDTNLVAGVERFTGAEAPEATRAPSVALAVIPCPWGPAGPVGPGSAVLEGGGPLSRDFPRYDDRHPTCGRLEIGRAANERPTTWRLRGEATGFLVAPFHLIVVELPATG